MSSMLDAAQADDAQKDEDINQLRARLEDCQKASEEYLAGWKRAKADYANFERESAKRAERLIESETAGIIMSFLTAYETLEQSLVHLANVPEEKRLGFSSAVQAFWKAFEEFGVVKIKTTDGQPVDPHSHEVLARQKNDHIESGRIIQEVSPGYLLNGKLLKAAKVIVAE